MNRINYIYMMDRLNAILFDKIQSINNDFGIYLLNKLEFIPD